jgi:Fic/DOC family
MRAISASAVSARVLQRAGTSSPWMLPSQRCPRSGRAAHPERRALRAPRRRAGRRQCGDGRIMPHPFRTALAYSGAQADLERPCFSPGDSGGGFLPLVAHQARIFATKPLMIRDVPVHDHDVWADLRGVAPSHADDSRLLLAPALPLLLPGWPVGLERKLIALRLPHLNPAPLALQGGIGDAFHFTDRGSNDHLLARPPSELAAWRLWELLGSGRLDSAALLDLARLLGGAAQLRQGAKATTASASGHIFRFAPPATVPARLKALLDRMGERRPELPPLLHAVGVYLETLLIHPLPDGNGRLARLLFLGALHQTAGLEAPICPLGPSIALHRAHVLQCYLAWETEKNPLPLIDFVVKALPATTHAVAKLL